MSDNKKVNKEVQYIYRPWITVKGVKIYATAYGKKAFKIPVNRQQKSKRSLGDSTLGFFSFQGGIIHNVDDDSLVKISSFKKQLLTLLIKRCIIALCNA